MSQVLEKLDRLTMMAERLEGLAGKLPRLAEMFGVAFLAGKASQRLGSDFVSGALGGVVADGLAHSRMPNNQLGGIALGTYFAGLGVLTIAPTGIPTDDFTTVKGWSTTKSLTPEQCHAQGGVWIGNRAECLLPER